MKILLADDHPLFREGVKPLLRHLESDIEVFEAVDFPSAFDTMRRLGDVDLALMDLNMPGMDGLDGVSRFRALYPLVPLVMLTASEEEGPIRQLLAAGVLGYITKSTSRDGILAALRQVMAGGIYTPPGMLEAEQEKENLPAHSSTYLAITRHHPSLSHRHLDVLRHLVKGLSNRQIGEALDVTEGTVKLHVTAILRILKVANRTEAVLVAQKMGLDADD